jgi:hypothetical protein
LEGGDEATVKGASVQRVGVSVVSPRDVHLPRATAEGHARKANLSFKRTIHIIVIIGNLMSSRGKEGDLSSLGHFKGEKLSRMDQTQGKILRNYVDLNFLSEFLQEYQGTQVKEDRV